MADFFANMLLGRLPTDVPKGKGRMISFAGSDSDIRLMTGRMRERVLGYLYLSSMPSVSGDISSGIKSNPSGVTKTLKDLIDLGEFEIIKHEGCVMEYYLTVQGTKTLRASAMFTDLRA